MKTKSNFPATHAHFFYLLKRIPHVTKDDLVWQYSNMLTTSLSEFLAQNPAGYHAMINDLLEKSSRGTPCVRPNGKDAISKDAIGKDAISKDAINRVSAPATDAELKKLRSAILHRLQKHGIDTTNWDVVNRFMQNTRIAGKRLYTMSIAEMKAFIPKMESILKKDTLHIKEIKRLSINN
jgi:hypothetical protein